MAQNATTSVRAELVEALSFCSSAAMPFWTYMLHCNGGALYVGHTDDLERRLGSHEHGAVAGFTADRLPVKLIWSEYFTTRIEALEMERRIKGGAGPKSSHWCAVTGIESVRWRGGKARAGLR